MPIRNMERISRMTRPTCIILEDVKKEKNMRLIEALKTGKCAYCGKPIPPKRKYYCSEECRLKFYKKYKYMITWEEVRRKVLERDNYTCVICGKPAEEVDHIVPVSLGGALFDMDNLQSLCKECHKKKTKEDRKKLKLSRKLKNIRTLDYFIGDIKK